MISLLIPLSVEAIYADKVFMPRIVYSNNTIYEDMLTNNTDKWYSVNPTTVSGNPTAAGYVEYGHTTAYFNQYSPSPALTSNSTYLRHTSEDLSGETIEILYYIKDTSANSDNQFLLRMGNGLDITETNASEGIYAGFNFKHSYGYNTDVYVACYDADETVHFGSIGLIPFTSWDQQPAAVYMRVTQSDITITVNRIEGSELYYNETTLYNYTLSGCSNSGVYNLTMQYRIGTAKPYNVSSIMVAPTIPGNISMGNNITAIHGMPYDYTSRTVRWYADDSYVGIGDSYIVQAGDMSKYINAVINVSYISGGLPYTHLLSTPYQYVERVNIPPNISSGSFNATSYTSLRDMSYSIISDDADDYDEFINVTFEWYVDGSLVLNETVNASSKPYNHSSALSHLSYSAGDNVSLYIYAFDGAARSAAVEDSTIITAIAPVLSAGCDDISIYHNINLSCSYSVTDPDDTSWAFYVNDSDINISSDGITADLSHDPVLLDYGCRNVTVNVTDGILWDSDEFGYCVLDSAPILFFSLSAFYYIDSNISVDVTTSDPEDDPINLTYTWLIDNVIVKQGYLYNLSSYNVYLESANASDLDVITLNISVSDTLLSDELIKESVYRVPSDNFLSNNYCPDDIEGTMLLFIVFVILAFFLVIDLMITLPILGIISGFGFMGLGLIIFACHPMMGFIVSGSGLLYFMYNIFARQF